MRLAILISVDVQTLNHSPPSSSLNPGSDSVELNTFAREWSREAISREDAGNSGAGRLSGAENSALGLSAYRSTNLVFWTHTSALIIRGIWPPRHASSLATPVTVQPYFA